MSIAACLIAKNEERIISSCIKSLNGFVDKVLVSDTGSEDNTIEVADSYGAEVSQDKWVDFSTNRNIVINKARNLGFDSCLIIDCDEQLEFRSRPKTPLDLYSILIDRGRATFYSTRIFSLKKPFKYRGVLHEFVQGHGKFTQGVMKDVVIKSGVSGARSTNKSKYLDDALLISNALDSDRDPDLKSRYEFYLAQSYRDAGIKEFAIHHYLKRSKMGGWNDEVFFSLYEAGYMSGLDGLKYLAQAMKICPNRAEPYWAATKILNENQMFQAAWSFAVQGVDMVIPKSGLFLQNWIYDYAMWDEFSICAQRVGQSKLAKKACEHLLTVPSLPDNYIDRIKKNLSFCK